MVEPRSLGMPQFLSIKNKTDVVPIITSRKSNVLRNNMTSFSNCEKFGQSKCDTNNNKFSSNVQVC